MNEWYELLILSTNTTLEQLYNLLPKLIGALVLLLVGLVVSKLIEKSFYKIFKLIGINRLVKKSGLNNTLKAIEIRDDLAWIFARMLFWIILFIFLLPISNLLGLVFFADLVKDIVNYIPNILAALLILLVGSWAAKLISSLVRGSTARVGSEYAKKLGSFVNFFVMVIIVLIALLQLNIEVLILTNIITYTIIAVVFGLALAFALGAKDILKMLIAGKYLNKSLSSGSHIKLYDLEGKVIEIGTIMTVVELESGKKVSIPNSKFL
ncbi:MAG: mechanosensitive ion channel [Caldithrix sp.]|nr:mechanosensitive ion channel [Caldithrix sp.]